ncbi:MAG TPA: DUF3060 domain-containing protein [Oculatellaceae cyanobacterium]
MLETSGRLFFLRTSFFAVALGVFGALSAQAQTASASAGAAGAGSAGGGVTVIKGHARTLTQTVKGGSVRIVGDANTITLRGKINMLHVNGDENGVRVDEVKSISTKGDGNLVKWKKAAPPSQSPQVKNSGDHNTIEKDDGGSLTPPENSAMNKSNAAKTD